MALVLSLLLSACGGSASTADPEAAGDAVAYALDGNALMAVAPDDEEVDQVAGDVPGFYIWGIGDTLWVGNFNDFTHLDTKGKVIGSIDLGEAAYAVVGDSDIVWVIAGTQGVSSILFQVDASNHEVIASLASEPGTWFVDVATDGESVWVIGGDPMLSSVVSRVNPVTMTFVAMIDTGMIPNALAHGEGALWVAGTIIDPANPQAGLARVGADGTVDLIPLGPDSSSSVAVAFGSVWLAIANPSELVRVDSTTLEEIARITVGSSGSVAPTLHVASGRLWVENPNDRRVYEVDPDTNEISGGFNNPSLDITFVP